MPLIRRGTTRHNAGRKPREQRRARERKRANGGKPQTINIFTINVKKTINSRADRCEPGAGIGREAKGRRREEKGQKTGKERGRSEGEYKRGGKGGWEGK